MKHTDPIQKLIDEGAFFHRGEFETLIENAYMAGAAAVATIGSEPKDVPALAKDYASHAAAWRFPSSRGGL